MMFIYCIRRETDISGSQIFKQVEHFVYLDGNISENGRVDVEMPSRIQTGNECMETIRCLTSTITKLAFGDRKDL